MNATIQQLEVAQSRIREYRDACWDAAESCRAFNGQSYTDRMNEYRRSCAQLQRIDDQLTSAYRDLARAGA